MKTEKKFYSGTVVRFKCWKAVLAVALTMAIGKSELVNSSLTPSEGYFWNFMIHKCLCSLIESGPVRVSVDKYSSCGPTRIRQSAVVGL